VLGLRRGGKYFVALDVDRMDPPVRVWRFGKDYVLHAVAEGKYPAPIDAYYAGETSDTD
jgi:hypothetical protein